MLGRSHMAIGAVTAVTAAPLVLHTHWQPMRQLLGDNWHTIPHVVVAQAVWVVAAVIGAALVDLDQRDSLAARKVEFVGGIPIFAALAVLVFLLHRQTSITAWGLVLLMSTLFGTARNITRLIGLGILGIGLLYAGWHHTVPLAASLILVVWLIGAMFTNHRTFTHSLPGLLVFAVGVLTGAPALGKFGFGMLESVVPYGLILGYIMHMLADMPSGGIPLLWPWGRRFGFRLIETGDAWDQLIGGIAILGFAALVVV